MKTEKKRYEMNIVITHLSVLCSYCELANCGWKKRSKKRKKNTKTKCDIIILLSTMYIGTNPIIINHACIMPNGLNIMCMYFINI